MSTLVTRLVDMDIDVHSRFGCLQSSKCCFPPETHNLTFQRSTFYTFTKTLDLVSRDFRVALFFQLSYQIYHCYMQLCYRRSRREVPVGLYLLMASTTSEPRSNSELTDDATQDILFNESRESSTETTTTTCRNK